MIGRRTGITALVVVLMALAAYGLQSTATPRDAGVVGSAEAFVCALPQAGFCRFDTSGAVPLFLGADRYDVDSGPDAFDVLGDLAPAAPCAQRATSLATFSLSPSPVSNTREPLEVHVELDGCRRILAGGYQSLSAPTEFVDALTLAAG